ncbi:hypothetical protein T458_14150 [Brevibacillus panacihumi W25]|uniref:histidine kinase n=1 Tax=Brevibacillus panacihumi W25 TaxID=1408254 RepID=V6M7X6_9BACL|nr:histidine kinase [Brevibacillus panacihumi]EST54619.1 hypothetical protein T458_14150 [Brevibacillus panacihumi W25]
MNQLLKEVRFVVYLIQWILLVAFFYFYMESPAGNPDFATGYLTFCGLYIALLCFALPNRLWLLLGLVDMCFALFLIVQTGNWHSPLLLYAFTSLFMLMVVLSLKQVILVSLVSSSVIFFSAIWFPGNMVLEQSQLDHLHLLLSILIWTSLAFWWLVLLRAIKAVYSRGYQVYLFMRNTASTPIPDLCSSTEKLVQKVFRTELAYLCLYQGHEEEGNWKREFFLNTLLDVGAQEWRGFRIEEWEDMTGRSDTYACMPLRLDQEAWGCLIFLIAPNRTFHQLDQLLLRMIAIVVCQQIKQNRVHYEMAQSLHEEMRKKLAQDMHDGLAQQLFFLSAQLFQLKNALPDEAKESVAERLDQIEDRIKWCHGEVRHTITHLRVLRDSEPIAEAIEQLVRRLTAGTDLEVRFSSKGSVAGEALPVLDAIYRMVEEATANVIKHARARSLAVSVEVSSIQWKVKVRDDGIGFVPEEKSSEQNYGVIGMKERISQVGGTLYITANVDEGTELLAIIPRKGVEMYG